MEQKPDAVQEVRQSLMTLRIIVFALAVGIANFIGYVLIAQPRAAVQQQPMLWMMMAGFAGAALLARVAIPGIVFSAIRRKIAHGTWPPAVETNGGLPRAKTDEGLLMAALQLKTIIGCAILEAPGFANAYAYMAERHVVSLAITLALILMIVAHFPLRFWLDGWLERQQRWLDAERSLHPLERDATS